MKKINGVWVRDDSDTNDIKNPGISEPKKVYTGENFDYLGAEYLGLYRRPVGRMLPR